MPTETILQSFARHALHYAVFAELSPELWSGRVPDCKGAVAYGPTKQDCESELYSVLEDWALVAIQRGFHVPVIDGVDLNTEENRKYALQYS
jgi:predicted RNase H-like HicB family nuclease